jgi:hypothetical protein
VTLLNLTQKEAAALDRELASAPPELASVKDKLTRALGPQIPDVIPGQTTIDDALEEAA